MDEKLPINTYLSRLLYDYFILLRPAKNEIIKVSRLTPLCHRETVKTHLEVRIVGTTSNRKLAKQVVTDNLGEIN